MLVLRLVITAALAELSWRFIEDPVRRGVVSRWWTNRRVRRRQMVGVVVGATAGVFGLCTAVIAHTPQVDEITASIQAGQAALDAQTEVPAALVTVAVDPAAEAKAKAVLARPNSRGPTTRSPVTTRPRSALATSVPTSSSQTPGLSSSQTPGLSSSQTPGPSTTQADRRPTGFGPTTLSVGGGSSEPDATTASPTTTVPAPTTTTIVVPRRVVHYAIPSLAVGDSVMLGSAPALKKTFGRSLLVDAKVGRQFETGLEVLEKLKKDGALGDVVIVHLGDNGAIKSKLLDRLLRDVADVPAVVIVAPKVPFAFETDQRALLYRRTQPMANVRVADWTSLAAAHPDFLYTDFVHLRPPGAKAYAELLAETIIRMCGPPDAGDATQPPLLLERCVARLPPDALVSTTTSPVSSTDPTAPAAETTPPS